MMSTQDFPPPTRVSKTAYVQRIRLVASGWPSHATAPRAFDLSAVGSASLGQERIEAIEERPLKAQDLRSAAFQCVCPAVGTSTVRRSSLPPSRTAMVSDRAPRTCSLQYPLSGLQDRESTPRGTGHRLPVRRDVVPLQWHPGAVAVVLDGAPTAQVVRPNQVDNRMQRDPRSEAELNDIL
jgi:hypothetical protein